MLDFHSVYLKSLTLKGFKSFASATTLKFEPGICAVVGPNGSGKSNVVDALAWVMGEQGAKTLRGGKMEDVIFAGAGERKPLGRAEVTLTIDNSDGALPIDYREVSVTRRMFRDGASEYEINGTRARLMDIQELLSDSGIGREMHVIVGQGRLAQILESRPEDRRAFIEEAAGVLKHRRRKEKAQRKLVSMQANLDRLNDLTAELRRQLKPLARQAEAAKRAATVQADLRDARLKLAGHQLVELREKLGSAESQARILAEQVETVTEQLEEATGIQMELEAELGQISPQADKAQQLWFTLSSLAERVAATRRIAEDRAGSFALVAYQGPDPDDLQARAERADEELAELTEAVEIAAERLETIREQVFECEERAKDADREHLAQVRAIADRREGVVRLLAAQESLQTQVSSAEAEIARHAEQLEETRARANAAEKELREVAAKIDNAKADTEPLREAHVRAAAEADAAEKRLDQLRDTQRDHERKVSALQARIDTLAATMPVADSAETLTQVLGESPARLADQITVDTSYDVALATALGAVAEALVADISKLDGLDSAGVNRTVILDSAAVESSWRMDVDLSQFTPQPQWLLDHVHTAPEISAAINRLLADVVVVADQKQARAVVDSDPRLRAVTSDGFLAGEGWVAFGRGASSAVEVSTQIAQAQEELEAESLQLQELSGTFEGAKQAAAEARVNSARATAVLRDQESLVQSLERDAKRVESQRDANMKEHERQASRATDSDLRLAKLKEELAETLDRLARVDQDPDDAQEPSTAKRDQAAQELAQVKAMEMEARLSLRSAEEKAAQQQGKGDALRRQAQHERQAKARHEQAMQRRKRQADVANVVAKNARDLSARVADAIERATRDRDEKQARKQSLTARNSQAKDQVNALRNQLNRLSDNAHSLEIAHQQQVVRMEEAQTKITEQLGVPVEDLLRDYTPSEDFDLAEEKARLKQAEKDLNALGKVNPLALEEFKALEERYEYLSTQLADVEQARKDLGGVIDDVDAKILQLFTDAWKDVEQEFPKVFSTLFPGGEGRLVLTEPDDMLATGIEVEARPPGKKVKRLSLLSGGEKSLTALAMLVAIFRARPSPFYVMDEVEAALDDVNLRRLIALFEQLRQDSQLIVITHQKPTMDVANVLYGVTMRGDGVTRVISQRMSPASAQLSTNVPGVPDEAHGGGV